MRTLRSPQFVLALALLIGGAVGVRFAVGFLDIYLRKLPIEPASGLKFHSLPSEVPGWRRLGSDPPPLSAEVLEELGTSNYLSRVYVETDAPEDERPRAMDVHLAYYTGMIDMVPHVPERCFVGGGMSISGASGVIVPVELDMERFPPAPFVDQDRHGLIRRGRTGPTSDAPGVYVRMPRGLENLQLNVTRFLGDNGMVVHAGYFFIANGGLAPRATDVQNLAFNPQDEHAYFAKAQFTSADADSPEELAAMAADFLNEMLPEIVRRTPDWISVLEGEHPATSAGSLARGEDPDADA